MGDDITIGVTEIVNNIEVTAQPNDQIVDISVTDNADNVTLNITPTVVEVNINKGSSFAQWGDLYGTLSDQTDLQNALNLKANLVDGKVPASELPSYVDDIIEVANYAALPTTGEIGKIYVTLDNNKIYRWSGSVYIEIASNSAIWGAITGTLSSQTDLVNALNLRVPYTGATSDLNLGTYDVKSAKYWMLDEVNNDYGSMHFTDGNYHIEDASGHKLFVIEDGFMQLHKTDTIQSNLFTSNLTTTRDHYLPNASGTLALTSQLHDAVTIGTANGLSLSGQALSLALASTSANGALSSTDWNTFNGKQAALNGTGFVKISGTTISYDNTTYLSGTVAIANGGTGATTADAALSNLGGTTVGKNIFTSANPSPVTTAYLKVKPDNSVEWLEANAFRIAIGAGTGNGTVTSVEAVGGYGGLTLTGTVTGSGQLTLGGTPEGNWPINITGNASSVNTVLASTNADFYLTFVDSGNGSPQSDFLYTVGSIKVNPSTGALTAGSFVKSGGTSSQYLMADGSVSTGGNYLPLSGGTMTGAITLVNGAVGIVVGDDATISDRNVANTLYIAGVQNTDRGYINFSDTANNVLGAINGGALTWRGDAVMTTSNISGTTNYIPKFTGSSAIGNSLIYDNGTNVGIGTTSPSDKLQVNGNILAVGNIYTTDSNVLNLGYNQGGGATLKYNSNGNLDITPRAGYNTIFTTGSVGIGTTSPNKKLHVKGGNDNVLFLDNGGEQYTTQYFANNGTTKSFLGWDNTNSIFQIGTAVASDIPFLTNNTERMRITSGGNVGIGTTSPSTKLDVVGAITASGGFFNSDMRLKDLTDYDYNVSDIKPITYLWKDGRDDKKHVGYSAQEVQKVMPDAVNEGTDGMLSVNYVEVLVAKIEAMEKEIAYLKSKI